MATDGNGQSQWKPLAFPRVELAQLGPQASNLDPDASIGLRIKILCPPQSFSSDRILADSLAPLVPKEQQQLPQCGSCSKNSLFAIRSMSLVRDASVGLLSLSEP